MSQRQIAIVLVVVAIVLVVYGGLNLNLGEGNRKAFLALLAAGGCTTAASYIWRGLTMRA